MVELLPTLGYPTNPTVTPESGVGERLLRAANTAGGSMMALVLNSIMSSCYLCHPGIAANSMYLFARNKIADQPSRAINNRSSGSF